MGVRVAEYLGMRTDVDDVQIEPATAGAMCPFMNSVCKKFSKGNEAFCSVRKSDGTLWIACPHRFCATLQNIPLSEYQNGILHTIAKTIFSPTVSRNDICVRREVRMNVLDDLQYNADYIMTFTTGKSVYPGPDRLVLEMQGGGETSQTKKITTHVIDWKNNPDRTNEILRRDIQGVGTIETNAWRRQQEQFIVKGNIAMKTWKGYGITFCMGAPLYDYLMNRLTEANLPNLRQYNWTLALIGVAEDAALTPTAGPVPLKIDENRLLFTNYQTFVQALINQGSPTLNAFAGEFINLAGRSVIVPRDGIV